MREFILGPIHRPGLLAIAGAILAVALIVLPVSRAQKPSGHSRSSAIDLNGDWMGAGYTCNGPQAPEHVRIEQNGDMVTATKVSGDDCVPAGSITWRGRFKDGSFTGVQFQVGWPNQPKSFVNGTARLDSSSGQLRIIAGGVNSDTITYTRVESRVAASSSNPDAGPTGDLCNNTNTEQVSSRPQGRTGCVLKSQAYLSEVTTYHWNNGQGATPGTISLQLQAGGRLRTFGPFQAHGTSGQGGAPNVNWIAEVGQTLPAGAYFVVDSDPATWSQNRRSQYRGFAIVRGRLLDGKTPNPQGTGVPDLNGEWLADYPGKVLRVSVQQTGEKVEGTLIDGNQFVPAGQLDLRSAGPLTNPLAAEQICAYPGFQNPYWIKVSLKFTDSDHFVEDLASSSGCGGFPVHWTRAQSGTAGDHQQNSGGGPPTGFKPCMVNAGEVGAIGPCSGPPGTTIFLVLNQDLKTPPQKLIFKRVLVNGVPAAVAATLTGGGRNYQLAAPAALCAGPFPRQWQVWLLDAAGHERGEIGSFGVTGCP